MLKSRRIITRSLYGANADKAGVIRLKLHC